MFGVGPRPVVRDGVLFVFLYDFNDGFEGFVFFDQVVGDLWADALDGVDIITAEQNTKVDELRRASSDHGRRFCTGEHT